MAEEARDAVAAAGHSTAPAGIEGTEPINSIARSLLRNPGHSPAPREVLFVDTGHILCGDLEWRHPATGRPIPLINPPAPQVEAIAARRHVAYGVQLVAQQAQKLEPLEKCVGPRVIFDEGLYRSWYLKTEMPPGQDFGSYSQQAQLAFSICSTESRDGFDWSEPRCCPIEVPAQIGPDGFTFFVDPVGEPEERYKAVWSAQVPAGERGALWAQYQKLHPRYHDWRLRPDHVYAMYGAVSPDGMQWSALTEPLMVHKSDTDTSVYYDEWLQKYVMYTRLYRHDRRWVGRAEADDFRHWGPVEPLLWPTLDDHVADDIYTNAYTTYPGQPQYHLMFPMLYHRFDQGSDVHLFSSADGICWDRVPGGPVISPGGPGEWDAEFIHAQKDLVPLGTDRVAIRYGGTPYPHKHPRWPAVLEAGKQAWAWWRKGRLAAMTATEEGQFCTMPMIPAGRELRLNVLTRRGGWVRVGMAGVANRGVEQCDPICADSLSQTVSWQGQTDIGVCDGEPVILQFHLRAAEVFGYEWR
jgi:hypothetical protein